MKKTLVGVLFTVGLVLLLPSVSIESSTFMHRMYNPNNGKHLYTRSAGEKDNLERYGWHYEGATWQTLTSGTPVYRLYNRYNGEHFYIINVGERDKISYTGWTYEGVAFYSYNGTNRVPVTRLYNKYVSQHHYVLDRDKKDIISRQGWKTEETSWYAMPNSAPNPVPAPSNEKVLNALAIWQDNTILCEGASPLEGLHYKGVTTNQNLTSFVNYMPRANDSNPCHGYPGEWYYNIGGAY